VPESCQVMLNYHFGKQISPGFPKKRLLTNCDASVYGLRESRMSGWKLEDRERGARWIAGLKREVDLVRW